MCHCKLCFVCAVSALSDVHEEMMTVECVNFIFALLSSVTPSTSFVIVIIIIFLCAYDDCQW